MFCRSQCGRSLRFCLKKDITPDILKEAEVILGDLESPEQLQAAENLKWIQLNNADSKATAHREYCRGRTAHQCYRRLWPGYI